MGDELYQQIEAKINEHNGNEANKENQIKIGNLGSGEYVAKGKYDSDIEKLNTLLTGKTTELDTANGLIADFKKNNKNNEEMQKKIGDYDNTIADLQKQLQETKIKAAVKVALMSEKASDIDYLTYKINEKLQEQGKTLELDENDNIKGWDDVISALKTQLPKHFETGDGGKGFVIEPNKLPESKKRDGMTKSDILKMPYAERNQFYKENPDAYKEIMNS